PAAGMAPINGSVTLPPTGTRSLRLESSGTSKTDISMRSPGPSGRSVSSVGGVRWLRSFRLRSVATVVGSGTAEAGTPLDSGAAVVWPTEADDAVGRP